jgi:serine/threonine protein kinase
VYDVSVAVSQSLKVIAGRYTLESLIGEGGMASVWRARDQTLARPVAVKLLFARDERDHDTLVARFLREARIAASVQHRNVIQIVDFGTTDDGQPYMVMELLEGESLGDRMHRIGQLPLEETVHIASMTLRGLAAVHDAGIIHRDLKPDNVYLKEEGGVIYPKILDFGISRSVEPASGRRSALTTREGVIVGTPEYMSPEQARGLKDIDRRTDIYSMGVLLYQMLTGALPFHSENVGDLIIKIVTTPVPDPQDSRSDIPTGLCDVIRRALSKEPSERFATASEMQRALLTAGDNALGGTLRRPLSDMPPSTSAAFVEGLAGIPRNRPLSQEFPLGSTTDEIDTQSIRPRPGSDVAPGSGSRVPTTREFANQFGKRKIPAWGWALTAVAAVGVIVSLTTRRSEREPAQSAPPKVETTTPTKVILSLRNVPTGARITVDGSPTGSSVELPRDGKQRTVIVSAEGKLPWQAVYTATTDWTYDVWLNDAPPAPAPAEAAEPLVPAPTAAKKPTLKRPSQKPSGKAPGALRQLDF